MNSLVKIALLSLLLAGPALAQEPAAAAPDPAAELKALAADVGPAKRAFVGEQLALTEAEAEAFWPAYDAHQAGLAKLNERRLQNILAYADVWNATATDEEALGKLAAEALAIEKDEAELMADTFGKLKRGVPMVKAVRYLQLESKLRAIIKYELAARIPYVH